MGNSLVKRLMYAAVIIILSLLAYSIGCARAKKGSASAGGKSPPKPPPKVCSVRQARYYADWLRALVKAERLRAWQDESLGARQASWLLSKAQYALREAKLDSDPKALRDPKKRRLLENYYLLLLRSAHQSRQGVVQIAEEKGSRLRAYISPIDNGIQTYSISIPGGYDPAVSWPLIVSMHGHGWFRPFQGHPAPGYVGAFCLSPQGRGSTDYKDLGEEDVLSAIAEIKRDYNIDANRVYLSGGSMGGTGAFHLGVHYADQFAGIFPTVGNADNLAWSLRWGWNRPFPGRFHSLRHWLQEGHTARAFAQNLFNLPTYILAGAGDSIVPPEHSRFMVRELRERGYRVEYREYPGYGHGGFPGSATGDGLAWTCGWTREPFPPKITWKAAQLKHGKAYWLRMEQFAKPLAFATIDAEADAQNHLNINTSNLLAFSFQRPRALFSPDKDIELSIDGQMLRIANGYDLDPEHWLCLRRDPTHGWQEQVKVSMPTLSKKRGCEGPINEAILAPFILVVGTQSANPAMNEAWQREADSFASEWQRRNGAPCLSIKDSDCDATIMQERNLILFGGSGDNAISNQLAPFFPLADITTPLRAQNVDLDGEDIGFMLIYPNVSYAPKRSVVMLSAQSPAAAYQCWGRFGNWFNWGVFDSKKYFDYAVYDARSASPESMLLIGWFGSDWQVESGTYFTGVKELRELMEPQGFPLYSELSQVHGTSLALHDLLPSSIDQMRGAIGLGRSFWGDKLAAEKSLGLRAPATLVYDLQGQFRSFSSGIALLNSRESGISQSRKKDEVVRFTVYGDDVKLAEKSVRWSEKTATLQADISGVKQLKLEAKPAGGPAWLHMGSAWLKPSVSHTPYEAPRKKRGKTAE
jgi:predicted esterase